MADKAWAGTTYGSGLMHKWLIRVLKWMDVRMLYIFAAIFIVPVCLLLNKSCGIIYRYFRHRHKYGRLKSSWMTYVNHCMFSQVVIDRFAMYAGKRFRIEIDGYDYFESLAKQPSGFIQLSSHIGNYEIAGYSLVAEDKPFNALVFFGEKESVMRNRNQMFSDTNIRMISVKEDMSHLFLIDNAITQGEIVSMPADRIFGSSKSIDVNLLGNVASFPMGPFSVATMRSLDVLSVNVMKESCMTYKIYVKPLHYDKNLPRKQQIAQLVTKYVEELEHMLKLYPAQWYNFFEFWKS